jgi:hypothetical protein
MEKPKTGIAREWYSEQCILGKAKIYGIKSNKISEIYIGSTVIPLDERLIQHRYYNSCRAAEITKYDDAVIYLIEIVECKSRTELVEREKKVILSYSLTHKLVNKRKGKPSDITNA